MKHVVERYLGDGKLEQRSADDDELVGFWQKALYAYNDARNTANSLEGRFDRAYTAARTIAVAILREAGYRTRGEAHHYVTFDASRSVVHDTELQQALVEADGMRGQRHEVDYGYESTLEADDVEAALNLVEKLFDRGARHLRAQRPEAKKRISMVRPRQRRTGDNE